MLSKLTKLTVVTSAMLTGATLFAENNLVTLDLTKAELPLAFNSANGAWTGTYDDNEYTIDSQCFSFLHFSIGEWYTWSGFTAAKSADNANYGEAGLAHQWSNMARGGIALDENGNVKFDEHGAPAVDPEMPYMVGFYSTYIYERPCDVVLNDGKAYEAVGCYVNLNSYTHYLLSEGDGFCRPFTHGDSYVLTAHGVHPDNTESSLDVTLASSENGDLTRTRGWKYVDLSPLGRVDEIYFTLSSTDNGAYGMNTPAYFCLDKLTVRRLADGVQSVKAETANTISYDRTSGNIKLNGADFAVVYNTAGHKVMSHEGSEFNINHLAHGVYVVRAGGSSMKLTR